MEIKHEDDHDEKKLHNQQYMNTIDTIFSNSGYCKKKETVTSHPRNNSKVN